MLASNCLQEVRIWQPLPKWRISGRLRWSAIIKHIAIDIAVTGGIHSTEDVLKASGSGWTPMNMNHWRNLKAACHTPIRQIRAAMSAVIIWTCWMAGVAKKITLAS